jgi:chitin synthase
MAHFLDKNFESATGFLHVLPGAWSAYRYIALIRSEKYEENLLQRSYFTPILNPEMEEKSGYEEQNMYLAEDRILSLGIYCQPKSKYTLSYIPDAVAFTDPMKDHKTLLGQRRRWINSSLFAFLYVWQNYYFNVLESEHNCYRSYISINVSMIFAGLSFLNSYFTPALYFFVLYITIAQIDNQSAACSNLATIISGIYCFVMLGAVGGSLIGKKW